MGVESPLRQAWPGTAPLTSYAQAFHALDRARRQRPGSAASRRRSARHPTHCYRRSQPLDRPSRRSSPSEDASIDRLAKRGMTFGNARSTEAVCNPSRGSRPWMPSTSTASPNEFLYVDGGSETRLWRGLPARHRSTGRNPSRCRCATAQPERSKLGTASCSPFFSDESCATMPGTVIARDS